MGARNSLSSRDFYLDSVQRCHQHSNIALTNLSSCDVSFTVFPVLLSLPFPITSSTNQRAVISCLVSPLQTTFSLIFSTFPSAISVDSSLSRKSYNRVKRSHLRDYFLIALAIGSIRNVRTDYPRFLQFCGFRPLLCRCLALFYLSPKDHKAGHDRAQAGLNCI